MDRHDIKSEATTDHQRMLDGETSHHDYYRQIAAELGLRIPDAIMAKVRKCRERSAFDGHLTLNEVPLAKWDGMAGGFGGKTPERAAAFLRRGDQWSLAGMVCALKAQAIEQMREVTA